MTRRQPGGFGLRWCRRTGTAEDPDATLLAFLQSTYEAAAELGGRLGRLHPVLLERVHRQLGKGGNSFGVHRHRPIGVDGDGTLARQPPRVLLDEDRRPREHLRLGRTRPPTRQPETVVSPALLLDPRPGRVAHAELAPGTLQHRPDPPPILDQSLQSHHSSAHLDASAADDEPAQLPASAEEVAWPPQNDRGPHCV